MPTCETCGKLLTPREHFRKDGRSKGMYMPKRFCSQRCAGLWASNRSHETAKDRARGRYIDRHGYVILTARSGEGGYQQPEHRKVMERVLGRKLETHETVHHKNGNRRDNRPENLELWASRHGRGQRAIDLLPMTPGLAIGLLSFGT